MDTEHQNRAELRTLTRQLLAAPLEGGQACERARRQLLTLSQRSTAALQPPVASHPLITEIWNDEADQARALIASFVRRWSEADMIDADVRSFASARELFAAVLLRILDRLDAGVAGLHRSAPVKFPEKLGIEVIDQDHIEIFAMLGGLRASVGGGLTQATVGTIDGMLTCLERHFTREEDFMAQTAYHGLEDHRAEHHRARTLVLGFRNDLQDGRQVPSGLVLAFLEYWLGSHVAHTDSLMGAHLRKALGLP